MTHRPARAVPPPPPRPAAPVQTPATLSERLAAILHGRFVGTIEMTCELGTVVHWDVQETLRSGHFAERRHAPRDPDRFAGELVHLLGERFTGRLVAHCSDGAIIRWVRKSSITERGTDLVE